VRRSIIALRDDVSRIIHPKFSPEPRMCHCLRRNSRTARIQAQTTR